MPTLRDFVEKARQLGIDYETSKTKTVGPRGEETVRYFRRGAGPIVIAPNIEEEDCLTPIVLSNLCRQLVIPPSIFGLSLGFIQDPFNPSVTTDEEDH